MEKTAQDFIAALKAKEREEYERKRDLHLIELGLVKENMIAIYSKHMTDMCREWDAEKQMYFKQVNEPISVTDEEYDEIKRLTQFDALNINNDSEKHLQSFLNVFLIISIVVAIIISLFGIISGGITYVIIGVILFGTSWLYCVIGEVLLNISNNLHSINSKVKSGL